MDGVGPNGLGERTSTAGSSRVSNMIANFRRKSRALGALHLRPGWAPVSPHRSSDGECDDKNCDDELANSAGQRHASVSLGDPQSERSCDPPPDRGTPVTGATGPHATGSDAAARTESPHPVQRRGSVGARRGSVQRRNSYLNRGMVRRPLAIRVHIAFTCSPQP